MDNCIKNDARAIKNCWNVYYEIIDSVTYNITPDVFTVSYKLSNADVQAFMRLDNTLFGILDTDKLGY